MIKNLMSDINHVNKNSCPVIHRIVGPIEKAPILPRLSSQIIYFSFQFLHNAYKDNSNHFDPFKSLIGDAANLINRKF